MAALGSNDNPEATREIWDLASKVRQGSLTGVTIRGWDATALSPDGLHLAAMLKSETPAVGVWNTKTGKPLGQLRIPGTATNSAEYLAFTSPTRLIAKSPDSPIVIWEIPSGLPLKQLPLAGIARGESFCVSPGGRYLTHFGERPGVEDTLQIYEVETGALAGEIRLTKGERGFISIRAVAFSPDGTELVVAFDLSGKGRLAVFDVARGVQVVGHDFDKAIDQLSPRRFSYRGPRLQWFPDKKAWFLYGEAIIDRVAGGPVWVAPAPNPGYESGPRRILDDKRVLVLEGTRDRPVLDTVDLPRNQIQKGAEIVAQGGTNVDVHLPPLTPSRLDGAALLTSQASAAWSVIPDPAPPPPKPILAKIGLKGREGYCKGFFTAPAVARGAVWYTSSFGRPELQDRSNRSDANAWIDIIDLRNANRLNTIDIKFPCEMAAFSPDGNRVAVRLAGTEDRIDVFSAVDGAHVAGWRPFAQLTEFPNSSRIKDALFLDSNHLLTLSQQRVLVLWLLPECKPLYRMDEVSQPGISPGGKYLVVSAGGRVRFFEGLTGQPAGDLETGGLWTAAAFHDNGVRFAATTIAEGDSALREWDLTTGNVVSEFSIPEVGNWLEWCGDGYMLIGNRYLVDLKQKKVGWRYALRHGMHAGNPADDRHWFLWQQSARDQLFAQALAIPEPAVKLRMHRLPDEGFVKPNTKVSLQLSLSGGPADRPNFHEEIQKRFKADLTRIGATVVDGAPVVVEVKTEVKETGQKARYVPFGPRPFGQLPGPGALPQGPPQSPQNEYLFEITRLEVTISFQKQGEEKPFWVRQAFFMGFLGGILQLKQGETPQSLMERQQWQGAAGFLQTFQFPKIIFPIGTGIGLGETVLGEPAKTK